MMQRLTQFLREVGAELKKITWPSRPELMESTVVVIVSVFIMTIFIGVVDQVFNALLRLFATSI
jgi:preprotein translocase subunit SecE